MLLGVPASEDSLFWVRTVTCLSHAEPPFPPPSSAAFLWVSVTDLPQKCLSSSGRLNCSPVHSVFTGPWDSLQMKGQCCCVGAGDPLGTLNKAAGPPWGCSDLWLSDRSATRSGLSRGYVDTVCHAV